MVKPSHSQNGYLPENSQGGGLAGRALRELSRGGTGAPRGPFEIFDVVGINTARNIVLQKMIDDGTLGRSSGEGFYKYSV